MAMPAPAPQPAPQRKTKTTIYLAPDIALGAKVLAAATGRSESQVVEDAVRAHLQDRAAGARESLLGLLDRLSETAPALSEDEAMAMANYELEAMRAERRRRQQQ